MILTSTSNLIFIAFFLFGLLNNILYVIILSAAIDLVGSQTPKSVVLLADVLPSFSIKLTAPFFIHLIPYRSRLWTLVALSSFGMITISLSAPQAIFIKVIGICMASASSGLGELTFLQLTHYYKGKESIGGFSSGTGGAGLFGSFIFLLLTNVLGIKVWIVLLMFSVVPFGFLISFYLILPTADASYELITEVVADTEDLTLQKPLSFTSVKSHIVSTLDQIFPLFKPYMLPLSTVYISEYVINQGISPTLLFPLEELPNWLFSSYRDIYVVYGFLYQLGVFISRSSVNFGIRISNLYALSILQFVNVVVVLSQSLYDFPFSRIWLLLGLILYEGLLGGFLYINTFVSVSEEVHPTKREFSMGCVSISDSLGIVLAGCINWWLEPRLCSLQVERGRDWCKTG